MFGTLMLYWPLLIVRCFPSSTAAQWLCRFHETRGTASCALLVSVLAIAALWLYMAVVFPPLSRLCAKLGRSTSQTPGLDPHK